MSNFSGHFGAGICVGAGVGVTTYATTGCIPLTVAGSLIGLGGALLPDMDIKSTSSRILYLFAAIVMVSLYLNEMFRAGTILGTILIVPQLLKHRGPMHSWIFALLAPCALLFFLRTYDVATMATLPIALFLGISSHLVLDKKPFRKS